MHSRSHRPQPLAAAILGPRVAAFAALPGLQVQASGLRHRRPGTTVAG
jgi:hypothetical protein